jgi:hypothetical protein
MGNAAQRAELRGRAFRVQPMMGRVAAGAEVTLVVGRSALLVFQDADCRGAPQAEFAFFDVDRWAHGPGAFEFVHAPREASGCGGVASEAAGSPRGLVATRARPSRGKTVRFRTREGRRIAETLLQSILALKSTLDSQGFAASEFEEVWETVRTAGSGAERLEALGCSPLRGFTADQAARLVALFEEPFERVEAATRLAERLLAGETLDALLARGFEAAPDRDNVRHRVVAAQRARCGAAGHAAAPGSSAQS